MTAPLGSHSIDRRTLLAGAIAGAAGAILPSSAVAEPAAEHSAAFQAAFKKVIGEATPESALVTIELPEVAENGNNVPYKLAVESPMTEADHITKLHLLSTANPQPAVATFHFSAQSGRAVVAGRMRLARTQDVIALAETNTGKFLMASTLVQVTIGGCGN